LWKSWSEEGEIPLGSFSMEEQAGNSILRINHQPTLNDNNHSMDSMASNAIFFNFPTHPHQREMMNPNKDTIQETNICMYSNNPEVPPNDIYP
jgi:hypothetical protein